VSKIIIRTPNHLGDSLMAQPAVAAFAASRPNDDISILIPEWARPVYRNIPDVLLLLVESRYLHGMKAITYQSDLLKKEGFETGVLLTPSFSSALIFYLAGVKNRFGYNTDGRSLLLSQRREHKDVARLHRSEQYRHLLEEVAGIELKAGRPAMTVMNPALETAVELLGDNKIDPEEGFVAVAARAVAPSRRWGSENYALLSRRILKELRLRVVLVGSTAERRAGNEVAGEEEGIVNICGQTDMETAAAVLSMAKLFIGNDSGLAHVAAAVGISMVVLSGADKPAETSPISDKKTVIIRDNLDCISCVKNICPQKGEAFMRCMKDITVDEVFAAVCRHLRQ
jgi:heptosyltransferase-2